METPRTREGRLTEHIMAQVSERMSDFDSGTYNRIYEGVLAGLGSAGELKLAIVPDNDWGFMAKFAALPPKAKRAVMRAADELVKS